MGANKYKRQINTAQAKRRGFEQIALVLLSALAFGLPLIFFPGASGIFDLAKATYLELVAILLVVGFVVHLLTGGFFTWRNTAAALPLLFLFIVVILSTFFSQNPAASTIGASFAERKEPLTAWLSYFVIFLAALVGIRNFRDKLVLIKIAVGASVLVSLLVISQRFGIGVFYPHYPPEFQITSTLGNPMYVGAYLVLILPLALSLITIPSTQREKLAWIAVSLLTIVALIFAFNRGSWLGAAAGISVLTLASIIRGLTKSQKRQLVVAFVFLVLIGIAAALVFEQALPLGQISTLQRIRSSFSPSGSFAKRLLMWDSGIKLIKERPVRGWGLDTFRNNYPKYQQLRLVRLERNEAKTLDQPHNQLLYLAYALGAPGLLFYLWLITGSIVEIWRSTGLEITQGGRSLGFGLVAAAAGYLVQSLFSPSVTGVTPLFWLILGLGISADRKTEFRLRLPEANKNFLMILTGFVALVFVFLALLPAFADYTYRSGQSLSQSSGHGAATSEALFYYRRAIGLNPWEGKYRFTYAQLSKELSLQSGDATWAEEALPVVTDGLRRDPLSYDLYYALGHLYYSISLVQNQKDYTRAKEAYARAVSYAPFFTDAYVWLGMSYLQEGKLAEAVGYLKKAIFITPKTWQAWDGLGQAYDGLGRSGDAVEAFRRVLKLNPGYSPAMEDLKRLEPKG